MNTISVIVPVWNREKLIVRCLDSIFNQTRLPDEIIVVDNASSDSTLEIVKEWMIAHKDCEILFKLLEQPQRGAWAARQKGLENASSEYVMFFDSDDAMRPNLIEKGVLALETNPSADLVCWACRLHSLDGSTRILPFNPGKPIEHHLVHSLLKTPAYMIRKDLLMNAGGWSKPLKVWDDYELGLRILLKDPKIKAVPEVLFDVYSQADSITGENFSSKEGEWEKVLDEMDRVNLSTPSHHTKKIEKIINYRRAILAAHYYKEGNKSSAALLMEKAVKNKSSKEKMLLYLSYIYTRKGGRGIWRIVGPLI